MGILRIGHQASLYDSHFQHNLNASSVSDSGREEGFISGGDPRDDFGDHEVAEVGCELNILQGEFINTPYELYDLPDLRDILSLGTWNSCLTEEERFVLSAYLPDMDQQTFWSTMTDLLGGKDMFFGSPLAVFFRNLKGGFYHKKVANKKSCLQFLQRLACFHSLRSYHESMIRTFSEMKRLWDPCYPSVNVKERILTWKEWKNRNKGVFSFDLNSYPDDDVGAEVVLSKKVDSIDVKRVNLFTAPAPPFRSSEMKLVPSNNLNAYQPFISNPALNDDYGICYPPKKGLPKVFSKGSTSQREQPRAIPSQSELPSLIEIPVPNVSRFPLLQPPVLGCDDWDHKESFPVTKVDVKEYHRSPDVSNCVTNLQWMIPVNDTALPVRSLHSSMKHVKSTKDVSCDFVLALPSDTSFRGNSETILEGDYPRKQTPNRRYYSKSGNCSENLVQESRELPTSSLETSHFDLDYDNRVCLDISDRVIKKPAFSDGGFVDVGGTNKFHDLSAASLGVSDRPVPHKTYKRRKVQFERR